MNHECAYQMIASMQQAKRDIEDLKNDLEEARKELKSELEETTKMVREIHESIIRFRSGVDWFKLGARVTLYSIIAIIPGTIFIVYLLVTGQISFKDLISWLL